MTRALAVAVLLVWPSVSAAQVPVRASVGGVLAANRISRDAAQYDDPLTGAAPGGEVSLAVWWLTVDARYVQGALTSKTGALSTERFIDTEIMVGIAPVPWFTLKGGRHLQRIPMAVGAQRWFFWELRARGESGLGFPVLSGYLEVWRALSGESETAARFEYAQGAEAGLRLAFPDAPIWARVGYRLMRARADRALSPETSEQLLIGAGVGFSSRR